MINKREQAIEKIAAIIDEEHMIYQPEGIAKRILRELESLGYVQKAEDQSLPQDYQDHIDEAPDSAKRAMGTPSDLYIFYLGALEAQQDMLKASFVKVEEEEK